MAVVGVIGGSGLDDPEILKSPSDVDVETPFGRPSSPLREGTISGWVRDALTEVYRYLCPLINHGYPSMKLIEKRESGSKVCHRHDTPKTPYRRLINDSRLSAEAKKALAFQHEHIDIVELTLGLQKALAELAAPFLRFPCRHLHLSLCRLDLLGELLVQERCHGSTHLTTFW